MKKILKKLMTTIIPEIKEIEALIEKTKFLESQMHNMGVRLRSLQISDYSFEQAEITQTKESFDYQWKLLNNGKHLAHDQSFADQASELVCGFTNFQKDWFKGKRVLDLGCGAGRFSHALLSMGALVTSADQSIAALEATKELCNQFNQAHTTQRIDLLTWDAKEAYDLVFCYGVVHHTGNTYQAIINASKKVKSGGRLFLMIYGYPKNLDEYHELNIYEHLRQETAKMTFEEKVSYLQSIFSSEIVHGYFDAISPKINDLLSFEEICDILQKLGFTNFKKTYQNRNHHLIADKT